MHLVHITGICLYVQRLPAGCRPGSSTCWRRRQNDPGCRNFLTHLFSSKPKPRLAPFRFRWVSRDRQPGSIRRRRQQLRGKNEKSPKQGISAFGRSPERPPYREQRRKLRFIWRGGDCYGCHCYWPRRRRALAGAATNSLAMAGGGTDSVQAFTAIVDGKRISGRFSKIWFKDGDHIECAVDQQPDGSYAVYAVRRPSDQTLWMFPHCSRGRRKHWKYASKMCLILALITTSFLLLTLTPHYGFCNVV